jgi:hypothetical protein
MKIIIRKISKKEINLFFKKNEIIKLGNEIIVFEIFQKRPFHKFTHIPTPRNFPTLELSSTLIILRKVFSAECFGFVDYDMIFPNMMPAFCCGLILTHFYNHSCSSSLFSLNFDDPNFPREQGCVALPFTNFFSKYVKATKKRIMEFQTFHHAKI